MFKPTRPYPLPANPEIVDRDGRPHARLREDGKTVFYPVSKDGTKYPKPAKRWYIEYRDANGVLQRKKGFTATQTEVAELIAQVRASLPSPPTPSPEAARGLKFADCLGDELSALVLRERLADPIALDEGIREPLKFVVRPA